MSNDLTVSPQLFRRIQFALIGSLLFVGMMTEGVALAGKVVVACAASFAATCQQLAAKYETMSQHRIAVVSGSTGKIFAQIVNGAPYDLFLSADSERPKRLEASGKAIRGSRSTYAIGRLAVWIPRKAVTARNITELLLSPAVRHIALANGKVAPYGKAAEDWLRSAGLWEAIEGKLVRGEDVGQAFSFVETGHADAGFVAASQVSNGERVRATDVWFVPVSEHFALEQQLVLLRDAAEVKDFLGFVRSAEGAAIISSSGYAVPQIRSSGLR